MFSEIQKAIYETLTSDSPVEVPVLDSPLSNTKFPYITIGEDDSVPNDIKALSGIDCRVRIHVWTKGNASKENKDIQRKIYKKLHRKDIVVENYNFVDSRFFYSRIFRDPDDNVWHGIQEFNFKIEEKE
jgi:hypothetical protein